MLYILHGNDRIKQKKYIDAFKKEHAFYGAEYIERKDFTREDFEQLIFGIDLFNANPKIIILDGVLELSDNREYVLSIAPDIQKSTNIFLFQEVALEPSYIKEISSFTEDIQQNKTTEEYKSDFSLWRAVYDRDKKAAWLAYLLAKQTDPDEKIHAGIVGQFRNMYKIKLAQKEKGNISWKDLGFDKEGGYSAALAGSKKYSEKEVRDIYAELIYLVEDAHSGKADFSLGLENFILKRL